MSIEVYKDGDTHIWVPVAKPTDRHGYRAFLPFAGLNALYQHGYKGERERSKYFDALSTVQYAFVKKITKVFMVQNGTKEQVQSKAKWRHGTGASPPGLGPTLGWVKVPVEGIEEIEAAEIGVVLIDSNSEYAVYSPKITLEPILCNSSSELEKAVDKLFLAPISGVPKGQEKPLRRKSEREYISRDANVANYVLKASGGSCECCSTVAPFIKPNGVPYLEVHHVKYLAEGGSDLITNAAGVCPNCHRELHYGSDKELIKDKLYSNIGRLVRE